MKKTSIESYEPLATAGILFVGHVFFASLPDLRRYLRMSTL
jgi:hypothetical protein